MANIPGSVLQAHIYTSGDPAVSASRSALLTSDGDDLITLADLSFDDRLTVLEEFREGLREAFASAWGVQPNVVFDFELGE